MMDLSVLPVWSKRGITMCPVPFTSTNSTKSSVTAALQEISCKKWVVGEKHKQHVKKKLTVLQNLCC